MRKIIFYLSAFWFPLVLFLFGLTIYFGLNLNLQFISSSKKEDFLIQLLATLIGVGISIFVAEGFKEIEQRKRIKKSFGLLKLVTIKYICNFSENLFQTLSQYNDISDIQHAESLLRIVENFNQLALTFDKSLFQIAYSAEFLDSIKSDDQFNKISWSLSEILNITTQLSLNAINAQQILQTPAEFKNKKYQKYAIIKSKEIRDNLKTTITILNKYIERLEGEIDFLFQNTGAKYSEFDRQL